MNRDEKLPLIVPMVSSAAVGPLGACHLPRMWVKILLHALGRLPAGYRHGTGGFDETTALDLGFDRDEFIKFVETNLPTYIEAEAWVRKHGKHLDAKSIRKHNEGIHRNKPAIAAAAQRAFVGLDDDHVLDATLLNDLDDWMTLHAQATTGKLPPLILSSLNGEMTEILREALDASGAVRATIHIDMPSLGFDTSKPAAEAKRDPLYEPKPKKPPMEGLRVERAMIVYDGDLYGPMYRDRALVAWITIEGFRNEEDAAAAMSIAGPRAEAVLNEISPVPATR